MNKKNSIHNITYYFKGIMVKVNQVFLILTLILVFISNVWYLFNHFRKERDNV